MFLILDTETTGLTSYDRIVSICWAVHDTAGTEITTGHHLLGQTATPWLGADLP
jgi:hypothetical protein